MTTNSAESANEDFDFTQLRDDTNSRRAAEAYLWHLVTDDGALVGESEAKAFLAGWQACRREYGLPFVSDGNSTDA